MYIEEETTTQLCRDDFTSHQKDPVMPGFVSRFLSWDGNSILQLLLEWASTWLEGIDVLELFGYLRFSSIPSQWSNEKEISPSCSYLKKMMLRR